MLRDAAGNRLFRKVKVKVLFPEKIFPEQTFVQHAGPHQGYGPENVQALLMDVADRLETLYPFWEFQPIELAPEGRTARWVFKFAGYRPQAATATPLSELTAQATPEPVTTEAI